MFGTVFHWIYCLNPVLLILLLAGFTVAFAFVYRKNQHHKYCKPVIGLLLLVAITAIVAATLLNRTERGEGLAPSWIPFESYIKSHARRKSRTAPQLFHECGTFLSGRFAWVSIASPKVAFSMADTADRADIHADEYRY